MGALAAPRKDHSILHGLTDKEYRFVHEYVLDYNATRAAIAAGYSERSAQPTSSVMLKKTHVAAAIRHLERKVIARCIINAENVREKIGQILYFKPAKHFDEGGDGGWYTTKEGLQQLPDYVHELITEVQRKTTEEGQEFFWIKFMSKDAALQLAARYTLGIGEEPSKGDDKPATMDWSKLRERRSDEKPTITVEIEKLERLPEPKKDQK